MKHSYLLAGISLQGLVKLLLRNRIKKIPFRHFGRLLFLLQSTPWTLLFSLVEYFRFHRKIRAVKLPHNPIIIIGHWRTGSTFLHQLLSIDKQFSTARVYQVATPEIFLSAGKFFKPVMQKFLAAKRPMDNVTLAVDEPQEDEYALLKMAAGSPLEKLIAPKRKAYFLEPFDEIHQAEKQRTHFKSSFIHFYKKVLLDMPAGNLLIKNPFHTLRLEALIEIFPKARFVHIHRNPFQVIPSTQHMWKIVGEQNTLGDEIPIPSASSVARVYKAFIDEINRFQQKHPSVKIYELGFDELETHPEESIHQLYNYFGLQMDNNFTSNLHQFVTNIKGFRKNDYPLDPMALSTIKQYLNDFILKYNYQ